MAVVADIEGLDLWVEPYDWTEEDRQAVRQFIHEYRERHAKSDAERAAKRAWLKARFGIEVEQEEPVR